MRSWMRRSVRAGFAAAALAGASLAQLGVAQAQGVGAEAAQREEKAWSSFLPILGAEAERRGYELPLPLGLSIDAMGLNEPHRVRDLRLALGAGVPQSVPRDFLRVSAVDVNALSTALRVDAWLFPFLNLYGIGGYSRGRADLGLTVLPGVQGLTKEVQLPTLRYQGPTYGAGMLLAGGYRNWFATIDTNRTVTRLDLLDSQVDTWVVDARVGWRQKFGNVHGSLWLGAMYQKSSETMTGSVLLAPGAPPLRFEVDQTTDAPWNLLLGTQWEIGRHWWVLIEAGVGERKQLLGSVSYRF